MFNNIALDVFIGLIFIFLLYGLLATILQELIARAFNLRARMLQKSLRRMLEDNGDTVDVLGYKPVWKRLTTVTLLYDMGATVVRFFNPHWKDEKFIKKFYNHPSIKYLGEDNTSSKPAYLHSETFSQTMIQLLRGPEYDGRTESESELIKKTLYGNPPYIKAETLAQLKNLFADARQDSISFKARLAKWFDEMQERTNGWYKKQNQVILIFTGFWIAFFFNVDTIAIYNILATDKDAREGLVQMAVDNKDKYGQVVMLVNNQPGDTMYIKQQPDSVLKNTYDALARDAEKANNILGLGKPWKDTCTLCEGLTDAKKRDSLAVAKETFLRFVQTQQSILAKLDLQQQNANTTITDSLKRLSFVDSVKLVRRSTTKLLDSATTQLQSIELNEFLVKRCDVIKTEMDKKYFKYSPLQKGGFTTFFGWLITALAISLGAPFWFDMLNKVVGLRGPKRPATPSEGTTVKEPITTAPSGTPIRG